MTMMRGEITQWSQPEKLADALAAAGVRHGETAVVNIRGVAADPVRTPHGRPQIRFCNILPIQVVSQDHAGDDQEIPAIVRLKGLEVPEAGVYDLERVRVHSNGAIEVICTSETRVRRHPDLVQVGQ